MKARRGGFVVVLLNLLLLVFGGAPHAAASRGPVGETVHIAVTGDDAAVWAGPGRGAGFTTVGGFTPHTPAVGLLQLSPTAFEPLYVVVGDDKALWVRTTSAGWRHVSTGTTSCVGQPGLYTEGASDASGWFTRVWAACRGDDGAIWFAAGSVRGGSVPVLNGWTSLGGNAATPSIARVGGVITFVASGFPTGSVWIRTVTQGWSQTPWGCRASPGLGAAYGRAWFGCRGLDDAYWYARNFGPGWSATQSAGGVVTSSASVAVTFSGATFEVRGTDGAVWENFTPNVGQPAGWSSTGGHVPLEGADPLNTALGVAAVGATPTN
jgi:hypothetical protein